MYEENGNLAWYAIRTRSRHEKLVHQQLDSRRVEAFLPLVERRRRWKDRWKNVDFPLFPGYCFARFPYQDRLSVVTAVGVVQILGINGIAIPVPDHEIEAVRQLVTCTLPFDPHPYLKEGMEVEVVRGSLAGVRGILIRKGARARLVVAISLIQQAASVELDAADVLPVG
ncbi:MAG: UpxY family transcription antiterminator [candidate division NC10 bacterium]|nr:UpxY family transcription antiterminator [candidate division NC10 bacterium]